MSIIITVKIHTSPETPGEYGSNEVVYEQYVEELDIPALVRFINQEKRDGASYTAG